MAKQGSFRFRSIRTEIAVAFACLILCTSVALTLNTILLSSDAVKQNSRRYTSKLVEQVNTNLATYVGNMTSISGMAMHSGDLQSLMRLSDPNTREGRELAARTSALFRSIAASRDDIAAILFIGGNGAVVSDRSPAQLKTYAELTAQDWYKAAKAAGGREVISSSRVQHLFQREYRWVISIGRQIQAGQKDEAGGVLLVDLNYNVINDLGQSLQMGSRGYVFILAPDGSLVYHPQQQLVYSGLKAEPIANILHSNDATFEAENNGKTKMYTVRSSVFGWKIVGVSDPEELAGNRRQIQRSSVLWGGISLVLALALSLLLSLKLTKPIKNLGAQMKKMETGDFDVRVDITSIDEIGRLARTFNLMAARIKQLVSELVREQEQKRISELKALQAQIQPHFLYNTLDSIVWMAEMGKSDDVVTMTSALSKLLRASINGGEKLVPIWAELAHVENYITIQTLRYRGQFTYSVEADREIMDCQTIKIVLQPLVENAIYHGIRGKGEPGHIAIRGRRTAEGIEFAISDDGPGIEPEKLSSLRAALTRPSDARPERPATGGSTGLGLHNVNHRVRLHFGRGYGLMIDSELEEGTTVRLKIPVISERGDSACGDGY